MATTPTLRDVLTLDQLREVAGLLDSPLPDNDLKLALFAFLQTDTHRLTALGFPPMALVRQLLPLRGRLKSLPPGTPEQ